MQGNIDERNQTKSNSTEHEMNANLEEVQRRALKAAESPDIDLSREMEALDSRLASLSDMRHSTPEHRISAPESQPNAYTMPRTQRTEYGHVNSKRANNINEGILKYMTNIEKTALTVHQGEFDDIPYNCDKLRYGGYVDQMGDGMIGEQNPIQIDIDKHSGDTYNKHIKQEGTNIDNEEETKLRQIQLKRQELEDIIHLEKLQRLKIEQEKQNIEIQDQMLEQYEQKNKELAMMEGKS